MNLKKVLWATAVLGLLICGFIAYQIYSAIFRLFLDFLRFLLKINVPLFVKGNLVWG